jgi:rhamnosyltransferase
MTICVISQKLVLAIQELLRKKQTELSTVALHDWFIYAFARSNNYKWYIDPTPTILYRQHATNVVGANIGIKAFIARLSKLKQGWYLQQILLIAEELGYQEAEPIKKMINLCIWDRCYLAVFAYQCRRRLRDRLAFAFFILFLAKKS